MHDIHQQRFSFIHFGMPSESWSRARKWDGGPPPLRDDGPNLYGFTNRPLADLLKIKKGNDLLKHTVTLALQCIKSGIAWTIENPLTSRVWETEEMLLLSKHGASPQHVHYCQYNKPWRKATTFLGWKVPSFNFRLCNGSHRSLQCNRSSSYHSARQKQSWRFSNSDCTTISKSSGSLHVILSVKGFTVYSIVGLGIRMRGRHFLSTAGVFIMPDCKLL